MWRSVWLACALGVLGCSDDDGSSDGRTEDAGRADTGALDASATEDAGRADAGALDASAVDSAQAEAGGNDSVPSCFADSWTSPQQPRNSAACVARANEAAPDGGGIALYCACNLASCPQDANGIPAQRCAQRVVADRCAEALASACGLRPGANGFCEAETNRGTQRCWEREGGAYECACAAADAGTKRVTSSSCTSALSDACP